MDATQRKVDAEARNNATRHAENPNRPADAPTLASAFQSVCGHHARDGACLDYQLILRWMRQTDGGARRCERIAPEDANSSRVNASAQAAARPCQPQLPAICRGVDSDAHSPSCCKPAPSPHAGGHARGHAGGRA
mgnify:CR=1 FL=1